MASINELINLSQYQAGDFGREGLNKPPAPYKSNEQKQAENLQIKSLITNLAIKEQEQALAERKRKLWDSAGPVKNNNKTTSGITQQIVDKEEAGGRDIITVGATKSPEDDSGYEAKISRKGDLYLHRKDNSEKPYDRVKVIDRAKKLVYADLATDGIDKKTLKASDYSVRLKNMIPQAETDLYGEATTTVEQPSFTSEDNRPVNPTGITVEAKDFLPEYKEKRGMIEVAKDFYFPKKDKQSMSGGKVMIQTPDGKRGYIPQSNLQKAIQRGAKLVQ